MSLEFPTNPTNFSQNYGNSDYDTRNYFSASYVIPLPYWGGPKVVTDGWEFAGTVFHNTGFPFSVVSNTAGSGIPFYGALVYAQQVAPLKNNHCGGANHSIYGPPGTFSGAAALLLRLFVRRSHGSRPGSPQLGVWFKLYGYGSRNR